MDPFGRQEVEHGPVFRPLVDANVVSETVLESSDGNLRVDGQYLVWIEPLLLSRHGLRNCQEKEH